MPLLDIRGLTIGFDAPGGRLVAVDGIDLELAAGETLGLVGESGCGKSLTALAVLGLQSPATRVSAERLAFDGIDLLTLDAAGYRDLRGRRMAMVFQDALAALDPVFTVGQQLVAGIRAHRAVPRKAARAEAAELLGRVGIADPARRLDDYPHELSGGMRQRVVIAAALAHRPDLIVLDEPTTALDVTIQAQVLALLAERKAEQRAAMLFITHDLGVVAELADRVAVMYAGSIAEEGPVADVLRDPRHPYARGLIASVPTLERAAGELASIPGRVPTLTEAAALPGCRFAPRCPHAHPRCTTERPRLLPIAGNAARRAACHWVERGRET